MTFVYNHTSNFCSSQIDDHCREDLSESEHMIKEPRRELVVSAAARSIRLLILKYPRGQPVGEEKGGGGGSFIGIEKQSMLSPTTPYRHLNGSLFSQPSI